MGHLISQNASSVFATLAVFESFETNTAKVEFIFLSFVPKRFKNIKNMSLYGIRFIMVLKFLFELFVKNAGNVNKIQIAGKMYINDVKTFVIVFKIIASQ